MSKSKKSLTNKSDKFTVIEKLEFEKVDAVFDALHYAFITEEDMEEERDIDSRFLALWNIFLASVGWTEDQYWAEHKKQHSCPKCSAEANELADDEELDLLPKKEATDLKSN
jgi:hypothetical protein